MLLNCDGQNTLHYAQTSMQGRLSAPFEITLALFKPTVCTYEPNILYALHRIAALPRLQIIRSRSFVWNDDDAAAFYAEHKGKFYFDRLVCGMTAGRAMALALAGPSAIEEWRALIGPTKAYRGAWEAPTSLRAQLGLGDTRNGFHGSGRHPALLTPDADASALHEIGLLFPGWDAASWLAHQRTLEIN